MKWQEFLSKYESGVICGLELVNFLNQHLLDHPFDESAVLDALSTHPEEDVRKYVDELQEWLARSRAAIGDGVRLSNGLLVPKRIVERFRVRDFTTLEWETVELARHPGMREQQFKLIPRRLDGIRLPIEEVAYALVTKYREDGENKEVFCVQDSTQYFDPGRIHYTASERYTTIVSDRKSAEDAVLDALRKFLLDEES